MIGVGMIRNLGCGSFPPGRKRRSTAAIVVADGIVGGGSGVGVGVGVSVECVEV
jgi:hypothetical protein